MKGNKGDKKLFDKIIAVFSNNNALIIVMKYGVFGVLWILMSDYLLQTIAQDFEIYRQLQTYKGWFFIIITMAVVYVLIYNREKRIKIANKESFNAMNELKHMAYYDTLTELPNREIFIYEIKEHANRCNGKFAIALLDIDNFKFINDTLGHFVGDDFLKFIGSKLSQKIKPPDMVARLGGDEFAILIKDYESDEKLMDKIEAIKANIGNSWNSGIREFFISVSIGVAIFPDDGNDYRTLLKNSDIAMYAAKKDGKNKILFYEEGIHEETLGYIKMANKIQKGLDNREFEMYYQPQIDLSSGDITGVEALVRWHHIKEEYISPAEFIPVAEITGQIYDLERRIVRNVLEQKKLWEEQGINMEISINLSSKSLISYPNFKLLEEIFLDFEADYSNIVVEITETAAISNIEIAIERLNVLKKMGLKIALDDFGTGYSSLTYLLMLPIDIIKLDKSYINSQRTDTNDISIVKFIISLAHSLGLRVVAEGIETRSQLEYLKNMNCEYGQGYFIGKPMNVKEINEILFNN